MTSNGLALTEAIYLILIHCCEVVRKANIDCESQYENFLSYIISFPDINTQFLKSKTIMQNIRTVRN